MLTLFADGAESLWDELLPEEVRVLPDDLARLDELLSDPALLAPIAIRWERELAEASRFADRGRPSLAMETYVRLMVLKHRCGWGYETLMREVSVDPATRTVHVAGGCTWADVDKATHEHGLAVPCGVISTTGVTGVIAP